MKKLQNIDAILFDLMGVLLFQKDGYTPNDLVDKIDSLIGRVTNDSIFKQEVLKNFQLNEAELDKVIVQIVNKYEPFKKLWELLPDLKKHYKLGIINNGTALTLSHFDKELNFDKYFDLFISSAREGVKKPTTKIFLLAAKRLNVNSKRCLFMDDSEKNINGAQRIGMQTICWSSKDEGFNNFTKLINN